MYVTLFWSFFTFVTYPGNYMMWTRRYIRNVRQLYVTAYLLPPPFIKQQRSSFIKLFSIHIYSKRFTSRWFGEVFVLRFSDKTYKPLKFIKRVHLSSGWSTEVIKHQEIVVILYIISARVNRLHSDNGNSRLFSSNQYIFSFLAGHNKSHF